MLSDQSAALRRDLARLIGSECVLEPRAFAPYTHDATIQRGLSGTPDAVVCPSDARALACVLEWCYAHDQAVVPRGGGSGLAGGAVALEGGVVCSVERLNRVLAVEPELWRMSVQAGVRTADIHRLARENGLLFAPDPGAAEQSHIGGNFATNAGGPHAYKYGPTGVWVTGAEVAIAPGELLRLGGTAVKDVVGYDLLGLLSGSEGTLGIVTELQLRLLPAPESAVAVVVLLDGASAAQQTLLELVGSGLRPAVLDFLDGVALAATAGSFPGVVPEGANFALLLELDGAASEVERQSVELEQILGQGSVLAVSRPDPAALWRWRGGMNGVISAKHGGKVSEDVCVPIEHLARAVCEVHQIGADLGLGACAFGHAGDGIVHATFMLDISDEQQLNLGLEGAARVFQLALELDGSISGEHGVGLVKRDYVAAQLGPAALAVNRQIKDALDPKGLLNPGKKHFAPAS